MEATRFLLYHSGIRGEVLFSNVPLKYTADYHAGHDVLVLSPVYGASSYSMSVRDLLLNPNLIGSLGLQENTCAWYTGSLTRQNASDVRITMSMNARPNGFFEAILGITLPPEDREYEKKDIYVTRVSDFYKHQTEYDSTKSGDRFPDSRKTVIVEKRVIATQRCKIKIEDGMTHDDLLVKIQDGRLVPREWGNPVPIRECDPDEWQVTDPTEEELAVMEGS